MGVHNFTKNVYILKLMKSAIILWNLHCNVYFCRDTTQHGTKAQVFSKCQFYSEIKKTKVHLQDTQWKNSKMTENLNVIFYTLHMIFMSNIPFKGGVH